MNLSSLIIAALLSLSAPNATPVVEAPTVEKTAAGDKAPGLFFAELRAHLEDGYVLVGLSRSGTRVEVELAGAETVVLVADLDARGRVARVEVLSTPSAISGDPAAVPIANLFELGSFPDDATIEVAADAPELRIRHRGRLLTTLPIGSVVIDEAMME